MAETQERDEIKGISRCSIMQTPSPNHVVAESAAFSFHMRQREVLECLIAFSSYFVLCTFWVGTLSLQNVSLRFFVVFFLINFFPLFSLTFRCFRAVVSGFSFTAFDWPFCKGFSSLFSLSSLLFFLLFGFVFCEFMTFRNFYFYFSFECLSGRSSWQLRFLSCARIFFLPLYIFFLCPSFLSMAFFGLWFSCFPSIGACSFSFSGEESGRSLSHPLPLRFSTLFLFFSRCRKGAQGGLPRARCLSPVLCLCALLFYFYGREG